MLARNCLQTGAVTAVVAWILALSPASAQDAGWIVSEVTGSARIEVPDQAARQAEPDLAVSPGARIITDDGGRLSLTDGASVMTLSSKTEVEIRAAPDAGITTIFQRIGVLLLQVERRRREHFEVETPYLAALVKGTRFSVSVAATGAAVHVTDGMVEVSSPAADRPVLVHPGQTATVDAGALDTILLDGGRSRNAPPDSGAASGKERAIRRAIGDSSVDVGAASDGLVGSSTLARTDSTLTDDVAAARNVGDGTALNGSLTGLVGGGIGETTTTGGLAGAVGGAGSTVGGTVGTVGSVVGGTVGGAGNALGGIGNTVQNTTNTLGNTTNNLSDGLGGLLQGF